MFSLYLSDDNFFNTRAPASASAAIPMASSSPSRPSPYPNPTSLFLHPSLLCKVRVHHRLFAVCHLVLIGSSLWGAFLSRQMCHPDLFWASSAMVMVSLIRILWMIGSAFSQAAVASTILAHHFDISSSHPTEPTTLAEKQLRKQRRVCSLPYYPISVISIKIPLTQPLDLFCFSFSQENHN